MGTVYKEPLQRQDSSISTQVTFNYIFTIAFDVLRLQHKLPTEAVTDCTDWVHQLFEAIFSTFKNGL